MNSPSLKLCSSFFRCALDWAFGLQFLCFLVFAHSSSDALHGFQVAATVETFPANNNNRVRGLLQALRLRVHMLSSQKQSLLQQLEDAPEDTALGSAATSAKLTMLIEQNMALKEESAGMVEEKRTLQDILKKHKATGNRFARQLPARVLRAYPALAAGSHRSVIPMQWRRCSTKCPAFSKH